MLYTNAYKGRANRQESASHLVEEFDRIEAAFTALANQNTAYINIYNHVHTSNTVLIDPANGQLQEITLTQDTMIMIKDPITGADSDSFRLTLVVNGNGYKIINGWGPQTWKEVGADDWNWIYTGASEYAGAVLEFLYDTKAWVCLAFSRNNNFGATFDPGSTTEVFPLSKDLVSDSGNTTLTWDRASYGYGIDIDGSWVMLPENQARHTGARYLKNWIATSKDLQSAAWESTDCAVATEAGGGQDGGNVDKLTFSATNGELATWMLLNFGRSSESSGGIKFAVTFDAKMAGVVTSGRLRASVSVMGVNTGGSGSTQRWAKKGFTVTDSWQTFGGIFDPVIGKDLKGLDLNTAAGARTLLKFAFESPPDGVGNPFLIEKVQVVVLKDNDEQKVGEFAETSIGSTLTLAATTGSTGTWVNGTKAMTLDNGEYVDFQDSLDIGKAYLCTIVRDSGNSCDVRLEEDRTFWTAYSKSAADTAFVKDAPFTFYYEGGVVKFHQTSGNGAFTVNIYEISGNYRVFDTLNANTVSSAGIVTYTTGAPISSGIAVGVPVETAGTQLLSTDANRDFSLWTKSNTSMRLRKGEIGADDRPSHGTLIEDRRTGSANYVEYNVTIPNDTLEYNFSAYFRKTRNSSGSVIVSSEEGGTVSSPSRYVDVSLKLTGGSTELGGQLVRIELAGSANATANDYTDLTGTNFQLWRHFTLGLTNNGTGNTNARLRIYPAPNNSLTTPGVLRNAQTGWCIVDFAQLELGTNITSGSSPIVPDTPRVADAVSTTLADGTLYNSTQEVVGDVTTNVWTFDTIPYIYKSITWNQT